jgi:hypothetical protein
MRPGVVVPAAEFVGVLPVSAKAEPNLEATSKLSLLYGGRRFMTIMRKHYLIKSSVRPLFSVTW